MEKERSSETSVNFYRTARIHFPEVAFTITELQNGFKQNCGPKSARRGPHPLLVEPSTQRGCRWLGVERLEPRRNRAGTASRYTHTCRLKPGERQKKDGGSRPRVELRTQRCTDNSLTCTRKQPTTSTLVYTTPTLNMCTQQNNRGVTEHSLRQTMNEFVECRH
jgi:hypothetical protein